MEIIKVNSAGFCFGVKRAVKIAIETAEKYSGKKIFTIGPIIHNKDVVNELEAKGVKVAKDTNIKDSVVILRSHGVEKETLEKLKKNNNIIIDAVCPYVKRIHICVENLKKENYFIVIIGDKDHPEVKAIVSYAGDRNYKVVSDPKEINNDFKKIKKLGVVAQTTQSLENYLNICLKILPLKAEFKIFNTICDSTSVRQKETVEVAKKVDCMLVVGGKHSANTKRLYELAKEIIDEVYHIENENDLELKWLHGKNRIGITAGASTPGDIIEKVIEKIRGLK